MSGRLRLRTVSIAANKDVVRAFNRAIGERAWNRLGELLDRGFMWTVMAYDLPGPGPMDRATTLQVLPGLLEVWADGSPRVELGLMIGEGDWVCAEALGTGSFRNGAAYRNRYLVLYEVIGGRLRTIREYMDTGHMAAMLEEAARPTGDRIERRAG